MPQSPQPAVTAAATEPGTLQRDRGEQPFATLGELHEAARGNLEPIVWDFLEGGAGAEWTLAANRSAFDRWAFRPRVLQGTPPPSTDTTLLGIPLRMPVLTAPFGCDRLFHPRGQEAVAQATAAWGAASIIPEAGSWSLEHIARAAPGGERVFQLHPIGPPDNFARMAERARLAGYRALCVTADCPVIGWRERSKANRLRMPEEVFGGNYVHQPDPDVVWRPMHRNDEPVWSWERLAAAIGRAELPCIVKGILTAEDAEAAIAAGAAAVYVSNHGGRQLDGAPASLSQLPEVAAAVAGRVPVLLDSGVRRGTDVIKALALGADAVVLGRLAAYGLAAAGAEGVTATLDLLHAELLTTLTLLGRPTAAALDPSALQPAR